MTPKQKLRAHLKWRARSASIQDIQHASKALSQRLRSLAAYQHARTLGLFDSLGWEVQTKAMFAQARLDQKTCVFPRMQKDQLVFHEVLSIKDMRRHRLGFFQPHAHTPTRQPDLLVLPCVGVDPWGRRIGQGKGYYDRLLASFRVETVVLCLPWQLVPKVPTDDWDQRMDWVITPTRTYRND